MTQPDLFDMGAQLRRQFAECLRERDVSVSDCQQAAFEHLANWIAWHLAGRGNSLLRRPARGVYLWGAASGRHLVMDCFFDVLPLSAWRRVGLQAFIQEWQGVVANRASEPVQLWCVDDVQLHSPENMAQLGQALDVLMRTDTLIVITCELAPQALCAEHGWPAAEPAAQALGDCFDVLHVQAGVTHSR